MTGQVGDGNTQSVGSACAGLGWWLLVWVAANGLVGLVGLVGAVGATITAPDEFPDGIVLGLRLFAVAVVLVTPLLLGVVQWGVLRMRVDLAFAWVPLTAACFGGGIVVGVFVGAFLALFSGVMNISGDWEKPWGLLMAWGVIGAVAGPAMGFPQWAKLEKHLARTGAGARDVGARDVWVLASTVGMAAVGVTAGAAAWVGGADGARWLELVGMLVGWLLYGAVTGTVLVWLLRQRPVGADDATAGAT